MHLMIHLEAAHNCLRFISSPASRVNFSPHPKSNVVARDVAHHTPFTTAGSLILIGFLSNSINPKKFPSVLGSTPGLFIPIPNGDQLVGLLVMLEVSG